MSSHSTSGSNSSSSGQSSSFVSRREMRASNATGALPLVPSGRSYSGSFDFEAMLLSLHELFEQDRQIASQPDATRCGICYLYFHVDELHYRDDGFYICAGCEQALGKHSMPMLRRQQK